MDNLNRDFKTKGRVIVLNYLKSHAASIQVFMGHRDNIYRRVMVELKLLSSPAQPIRKRKRKIHKKNLDTKQRNPGSINLHTHHPLLFSHYFLKS
jgi:hypothetical protein